MKQATFLFINFLGNLEYRIFDKGLLLENTCFKKNIASCKPLCRSLSKGNILSKARNTGLYLCIR